MYFSQWPLTRTGDSKGLDSHHSGLWPQDLNTGHVFCFENFAGCLQRTWEVEDRTPSLRKLIILSRRLRHNSQRNKNKNSATTLNRGIKMASNVRSPGETQWLYVTLMRREQWHVLHENWPKSKEVGWSTGGIVPSGPVGCICEAERSPVFSLKQR